MNLIVLHFATSLQVKRLAPKAKKVRMDHPFILGFCQHVTFYIVFATICSVFQKNDFLKLLLYSNSFCISDSNIADPRLLLFQNGLILKL